VLNHLAEPKGKQNLIVLFRDVSQSQVGEYHKIPKYTSVLYFSLPILCWEAKKYACFVDCTLFWLAADTLREAGFKRASDFSLIILRYRQYFNCKNISILRKARCILLVYREVERP